MQKTIQSKVSNFFQKSRGAKVAAIVAGLVVVVAGVLVIRSLASSFYASSEAEQGSVATNATIVSDTTASGGKAVQFNAPAATTTPPTTGGGTTTPPTTTSSGWPAAYNTGVPHGLPGDTRKPITTDPNFKNSLPTYEGPQTITKDGTVIDGMRVIGKLTIAAKNVVIKNSYLYATMGTDGTNHIIESNNDDANLLIEDSEISGMAANGLDSTDTSAGGTYGIGRTGYTLLRDNVNGSGDILRIDGQATVQDSWLNYPGGVKLSPTNGEQHNDVIQSTNATRITVIHNRMDNPHIQTSCMLLKADLGDISNVTVKNNLFNGGGVEFYWYDSNDYSHSITQGNGEGVVGNHFMRSPAGFFPNGGAQAGPTQIRAKNRPVNWSGNVWDDNGAPVDL